MTLTTAAAAGLLGAACGPRLRASVFRRSVPRGTRCRCPHCGVKIPPDRRSGQAATAGLPPSGRCPRCRRPIGAPAGSVEVVTAALFTALAVRVDSAPLLAAFGWLTAVAVALAGVDLAVHRLPDPLVLAAGTGLLAGLALTAAVEHRPGALLRAVLAGLGLFTAYYALAVANPSSLGFGDCKLAAVLGAALGFLGWTALLTGTLLAFALAACYGVTLLALRRVTRADPIPFGPFMLLGAFFAVLLAPL